MKSKRLLLMLLLAVFGVARAQVTIGDLETAGNDTYLPMNSLYEYSYSQQIYTADEIGTAGTINAITVWMYGATDLYTIPFDIYMVETDKESFTGTDWESVSSSDIVYSGSVTVHNTEAEAYTFTLDAPFQYSGQGNLMIAFDNNCGQWKGGLNGKVFTATDNVNRSMYVRQDSNDYDPTNMSGISGTTRAMRNVIEIDITPGGGPTCARPTNFVVSYTGGSTATVTWEGEASLYNIDINGTVTEGVTSPYVMNVLPATAYTVKVQADCGDLQSAWTSAQSFFTPCEAFDLPYAYGFEDANELNCWNMVYTANTPGIYNGLAYEGNNSFRFSSYSNASSYDQYLISPELNTTNGVDVTFYYAGYSYGSETFKVGYSTTSNDPSAFTWGDQITATGTDWNLYDGSFPAGTKFVGIYYFSNYQYYMYVDDFNFEVPSSCRKPTNLAASEIGPRTATLSWTENGEARSWNLLVNGELIEGVDNPHTLTGLTPETAYTVQVSPVCEVEKWSDAITFRTEVACPAPTDLTAVPTPISATLNWEGGASTYTVRYRPIETLVPLFFDDFESGTLDNWTLVDADGDGNNWNAHINTGTGNYTTHSGDGVAYSESYQNDEKAISNRKMENGAKGALTPDNWMITPQVQLGGSVSFWAIGQDASWCEEHFAIYVSTTGTNPSDFTQISPEYIATGEYVEYSADLGNYSGMGYVAIRHYNVSDMFVLNVDDFGIYPANSVNWIYVNNVNSNSINITDLTPETDYEWQVQAMCGGEDGESLWASSTFTTPSNCDAPTALNVTNLMPTTATLNWTGYQDGYDVWYRPVVNGPVLLEDSFENGLGNWTTIDADGDGNNWDLMSSFGFNGTPRTGSDMVVSMSYYGGTVLYPDNYLVSPQVELGGSITFWACAQDASYPAEVFGVAVSTTSNTDASAFTTIQQWTMTAKGSGAHTATSRSGNRVMGNWYQYTVDLRDYAGQTGYVALRHFNCSDMFYLDVDDITINGPVTEEPEWIMASTDATTLDIEDLIPETEYEWQVRGENRSCNEDGYTEWSEMGTFTTPGLCDNPIDLVAEAQATTATLSWTGYQESYNVTYYTPATGNVLLETGVGFDGYEDWTEVTEDEETGFYYLSDDYSYVGYGFSSTSTPQYLISPEFDALEGESFVEFMYYATGTEENENFPETFKIGYSTTDAEVASFTWGELYTVSGIDYMDVDLPAGAKYFAIQYESDHAADSTLLFFLDFTVVSNYVAAGEPTTLEGVTSPVTISGLTPETIYRWEVTGICGEEEYTEAVGGYFTTPELTTVTQTIALAAGVNWVSFYVETTLDDLKAALQATGGTNIVIQAKVGSTTWNGRRWLGTVSGFSVTQMYKIQVPADCEIAIEGMPLNPAELPITISNGANWIGFPFSESMSLADAFAGFSANQDAVSSKNGSSTWNGRRWLGSLSTLVPGQGYIYNSKATEDKTFVYPTGSSKAANGSSLLLNGRKPLDASSVRISRIK